MFTFLFVNVSFFYFVNNVDNGHLIHIIFQHPKITSKSVLLTLKNSLSNYNFIGISGRNKISYQKRNSKQSNAVYECESSSLKST